MEFRDYLQRYVWAVLTFFQTSWRGARRRKGYVAIGAVVVLVAASAVYRFLFPVLPSPVQVFDVIWLKQGWTEDQREKYYQTSQGTLIVPYSWFFALEMMPYSPFLFREGPATWRWWRLSINDRSVIHAHENLSRYRLIPDPRPKYNP